MKQSTTQLATKNKRTIPVATIRFSITIETTEESKRYLSQQKKLGRDREDRLKEDNFCRDRENYVATGSRSWLQTNFVL